MLLYNILICSFQFFKSWHMREEQWKNFTNFSALALEMEMVTSIIFKEVLRNIFNKRPKWFAGTEVKENFICDIIVKIMLGSVSQQKKEIHSNLLSWTWQSNLLSDICRNKGMIWASARGRNWFVVVDGLLGIDPMVNRLCVLNQCLQQLI